MATIHRGSCDCGFHTENKHQSYVDRALRIHSCEKWIERTAAKARAAAREAAVDRTPKPCLHKQATHVHGEYACYVLDRCRCAPCTAANSAYESNRTRQKAYGRWDNYINATDARAHVRSLMDQGMGLKQIAAHPGVSQGGLWKLIYGKRQPDGTQVPTKRITRRTHDAILAIGLQLADGAQIDGTGTRRRLQALVALGYSMAALGRELDITNLHRTIHGGGDGLVLKRTADRTRDLYDRWSMTLPAPTTWHDKTAATRARNLAKANGWPPPLAWDDELIDDPRYLPGDRVLVDDELDEQTFDEAAVLRRLAGDRSGRLTKGDRVEIVTRARAAGWSYLDIERRAGLTKPERYLTTTDQEDVA